MPRLNISVPHDLGLNEAKNRIKNLVSELRRKNGHKVSGVKESWVDETAHFSFRIMGFFVEGRLCIEPSTVHVEGKFPFAALPFKKTVEKDIRESARKLLS